MSLWLKIPLFVLAAAAFAIAALYATGSTIAREHTAASRLTLTTASPDAVWSKIAAEANAATWRKDVKSVARLADRNGHEVWQETFASGNALTYETLEFVAPTRLVRAIADEAMFGGTWTIVVEPSGTGTIVTITENGWIEPPPFRAIAKYVWGHDATINAYLRDLAANFGEAAVIAPA
jgi:hypothetical protein